MRELLDLSTPSHVDAVLLVKMQTIQEGNLGCLKAASEGVIYMHKIIYHETSVTQFG